MAPNTSTGVLQETDDDIATEHISPDTYKPDSNKPKLVWSYTIIYASFHLAALYGLYLAFTSTKIATNLFTIFMYYVSGLGIIAGAHRLWSHKAFKAKLPLTILLTIFQTTSFQLSIIHWARDHRVHHKYTETDADPHNVKRGLFFAQIGWLCCRKHPEVIAKGKGIDMSDLYADPILRFQNKYYYILMPLLGFVIPTMVPIYFWDESFKNAFFANNLRFVLFLHAVGLINSVEHMFGIKPYDRFINPSDIKSLTLAVVGEAWHNYHHTFPWDYRSREFGYYFWNLAATFIECMAKIGWAYDLKTASEEIIRKRVKKTGDGSHPIWGWGDVDQSKEEKIETIILYPRNP